MARKLLTVTLIVAWIVLAALDVLEGIPRANPSPGHGFARSAVASLGWSVNISDDNDPTPPKAQAEGAVILPALLASRWTKEEVFFTKKDCKIYKLYHAFLI